MKLITVLIFICGLMMSTFLTADYRDFAYSYQARTLAKGGLEFEYYIDTQLPDFDDQSAYSWRQQMEIEYGVSDRLTAAIYQSWRTNSFSLSDGSSEYRTLFDSVKALAKYRLTNPGQYFVDALLYLEYVMATSYDGRNDKVELKEVFSKDMGKFHAALNLTQEVPFDGDFELNYDAAAGYDLSSWFLAGVQTKGQLIDSFKISIGPNFTARAQRIYLSTAILLGLNSNAADMDGRILIGVEL